MAALDAFRPRGRPLPRRICSTVLLASLATLSGLVAIGVSRSYDRRPLVGTAARGGAVQRGPLRVGMGATFKTIGPQGGRMGSFARSKRGVRVQAGEGVPMEEVEAVVVGSGVS
eukprot:1356046-Amorphochlora_amoeboformis.AAC.1